jgi:hypothetical protein
VEGFILKEKLVEKARMVGAYIKDELKPPVEEVKVIAKPETIAVPHKAPFKKPGVEQCPKCGNNTLSSLEKDGSNKVIVSDKQAKFLSRDAGRNLKMGDRIAKCWHKDRTTGEYCNFTKVL